MVSEVSDRRSCWTQIKSSLLDLTSTYLAATLFGGREALSVDLWSLVGGRVKPE